MTECNKTGDEKQRDELCKSLDQVQIQKGKNKKPTFRILFDAPERQLGTDGKRSIQTLLFNLWDNQDIQDTFVNDFFITHCKEQLKLNNFKEVNQLCDLVVNDLFTEHTS